MLSDNVSVQHLPSPKRKKAGARAAYSDSQKIEAAKLWLVTGNLTQTAASLGIDRNTMAAWKNSNWWKELISELKTQTSLQLSSRLRAIATKSLIQMEDRLEKGDHYWNNSTQQLERIPVKARDLHRISVDLLNKSLELEAQPLAEDTNKQMVDQLAQLRQTFEKFAQGNNKQVEVTDVIFGKDSTDAVHDQREEGLQEGESVGETAQGWQEVI